MQPKRSNLAKSLACASSLLLAACQQGKVPQAQVDMLNTEPPSAGASACPALASDWLSLLPGEQRRIEPAHCSQHTGTPLLAWADPRNRQLGSSYTLNIRSAGGVSVANRTGLTEPRARLAQALPPGNYEWAVTYTAASGGAQTTQWRSFSVAVADGQARPQDLMDGAQLAAQVSARARPRMLANGSSFAALRNAAQQAEHLPALSLLRTRANAALTAQVPAMPGAAIASTAQAKAQALAELAQSARNERLHIEVLGVIGRLDGNANLIAAAKRRLLTLAAWAPSGASSESNASEANREVALAMAQGLDLLWNDLSAAERGQLGAPLRERLMQASMALAQLDREPYAAASLLSLRQITQALLLTAGLPGFPEAQSLLANAWELNRHNLYIWGTDGSQGPAIAQAWEQFAATTSMAAAVRTITGLNLYELPVLRRSAEQLIAFTPTSQTQQAAFGDDAGTRNLYDRHTAALRLHAQQGRDLASVWYWQAKASNVSTPTDASIWQLLLLGASSSSLPAGNAQLANDWFSSQAGLAAMHSDIRRPDRSSVYFRSSRFGAHGAAQAEQNALVYVSQGLPLLIGTGSMPYAGSPHHRSTRGSRYKNTLTVDGGFGQAESSVSGTRPSDPLASMDASGALIRTQSAGSYAAVTGDATNAYRALDSSRSTWTPLLSNAVRSVIVDKTNGLTFVYDWATSATPRQWELNYHSPNAFVADASTVRASNGVASVCLDRHGPATQFSQTSSWEIAPETAQPAAAHGRFTSLTRSTEFAHLTVLRESCRNVPLQISQKDAQITVLVNGRDTLQFDRRMFSLPSNAGVAPLLPIVTLAASTAAGAAAGGTQELGAMPAKLDGTGVAPADTSPTKPGSTSNPGEPAGVTPGQATGQIPPTEQRIPLSGKPLVPTDIFAQVDTRNTFRSSSWLWSVECAGVAKGAIDVPESGIHGSDLGPGLGTLRFGKVPDPEAPQRKVLQFRANKNDGLQAGAPRCELSFSATQPGRLEVGRAFWFGFGIRLDKWVTSPEEQIVAQIHQSDGSTPLNPIFALSVLGDKFSIYYRNNTNSTVTKASTLSIDGWSGTGLPTKNWAYFVMKATISADPKQKPQLQVWKDGTQIINYTGPFGYNTPSVTPFAKFGHYQWGGPGSNWSASAPTKTVLIRNPTFVRASGASAYLETDIRAHVMNN